MPATSLSVQLLTMTPDAEALIYAAMRQCYSPDDAADIFMRSVRSCDDEDNRLSPPDEPLGGISRRVQHSLINKVLESGHESPLEHVSFAFAISGVSRALSHQLVRHRIASYSQQSQRYVKAGDFEYVIPKIVSEKVMSGAPEFFKEAMMYAQAAYDALVACGIPAEDARFVLPNACATKLVVTMNCRALLHFFEERLCQRAQWEIRALAKAMYDICVERLPVVFGGRGSGAKCISIGYCPEHNSCGMMPKRGE